MEEGEYNKNTKREYKSRHGTVRRTQIKSNCVCVCVCVTGDVEWGGLDCNLPLAVDGQAACTTGQIGLHIVVVVVVSAIIVTVMQVVVAA